VDSCWLNYSKWLWDWDLRQLAIKIVENLDNYCEGVHIGLACLGKSQTI
jgi:hypothetical protein